MGKKVMTDDGPKPTEEGQEKSESGLMQKKTLIIAGIVIAVFLIAVIASTGYYAVTPGTRNRPNSRYKKFHAT